MAIADSVADAHRKVYGQIIAKAMTDDMFRQKLIADPAATLAAHGVHMPKNAKIKVLESGPKEYHLVIPPRPSGELDDEHLKNVAGGGSASSSGSASTAGCPVSTAGCAGTAGCEG